MQFSKNNLFYYKLRITSSAALLISLEYRSISHSFVPCFLVLLASSEHIFFWKILMIFQNWTEDINLILFRFSLNTELVFFVCFLFFAFTHVFYFVFKVHMLSCNAESSHKCSTAHYSQVVGLGGLEPPTSRLSGVRSNHLSYKPMNS